MNREQQVILTLLREIDEICGQNGIECYLTPRLALHAVRGGHMPDNPFAGGVLMKVSDIEKFRLAVQKRSCSGEPWNLCMIINAFQASFSDMRIQIHCAFV